MDSVSVIGIGKLGLCFALNLERSGYNVIGYDINQNYVDNLKNKTFNSDEKDVNEYLKDSKNIEFTSDIDLALKNNLIFIVVATPSLPNGNYDHKQVNDFFELIKDKISNLDRIDFVICCTTMPGYIQELTNKLNFEKHKISYNPEFIAQGEILQNQQYPDMILIGEADNIAGEKISEVYKKICLNNPIYNIMSVTEAEITKIGLNCFLVTKIAYANMIGDVAMINNCNPDVILNAIGSDSRIGNKFLKWGYGYGGPCLPRDAKAFANFCDAKYGYSYIPIAADESNRSHLHYYAKYLKEEFGDNIVFDYATYKKESTLLEKSQIIETALVLKNMGCDITFRERLGVISELKNKYGDIFKYIEI